MSFWRKQTDDIRSEVSAQDFGWFIGGGLATRQLKLAVALLLPVLAAPLFLKNGLLKQEAVGALVGAWLVRGLALYALGTVFFSKKMDRSNDRKVGSKLFKEYRRP